MKFYVKRLTKTAQLPVRGSPEATGYDLSACLMDDEGNPRGLFTKDGVVTILPGQRVLIPTGIAFTTPKGTYGRVGPRSGLAYKNGLQVLAGIIDRVMQTITKLFGFYRPSF